jgi:serine/threonine protein kinase
MSNHMVGDAPDPRIGQQVGGYRIESLLGVGGMNKVYAATAGDGTRVALKIVKDDFASDETFRRRFEREAEIARSVSHPNLVPVLDSGEHDGIPYMAQQLVEGCSLEHRLAEDGPVDVSTAVGICADVSRALQALWDAGMVHRDVKPGNILLDEKGVAYLTDFGLVKNHHASVLTLPGQTVGSIDYMAPEQIQGDEVSAASDIYSLGCVMFECVEGRPPFGNREGLRVLWAHLNEEPADPESVTPQLAGALKAALRKAPEERPASGDAYTAELVRAAGIRQIALAS